MNEIKTVRVRIAVAVDDKGSWAVGGTDSDSARFAERKARREIGNPDGVTVHWIEADVPLPLPPQTVEGTVTEASE